LLIIECGYTPFTFNSLSNSIKTASVV
jgi:hypothetical protein